MSVALYMDEHVPAEITDGLRRRGVDVLTVQEDGLGGSLDPDVLDRSTGLQRVLFRRDEDFLKEASARQAAGVPFDGIVYAHQLRVSVGKCVLDLEILCQAGDPDDFSSRVINLPL